MFDLFGVKIEDLTLGQALDKIEAFVKEGGPHLVVTANPEIILAAKKNPLYLQALSTASLVVPDGAGLVLASYLYRQPITKGRITGVDLTEALVKESGERGFTIFLAGSTNHILNKTTHYFTSKYNNIRLVGSLGSDKPKPHSQEDYVDFSNKLLQAINQTKPDILLLALGHPKQELWLARNMPRLPIKVGLGIGGTFDYLSGEVKRAPAWLRKIYLEWLWRLAHEPWRLARIFRAVCLFPLAILIDLSKKLFHMEHNKPN